MSLAVKRQPQGLAVLRDELHVCLCQVSDVIHELGF